MGASSATYTADLDLPAHSRKRFQLCVPADGFKDASISLGPLATGRESTVRHEVGSDSTLVVVAGGEEGFLRFLSGTSLGLATTATGSSSPRTVQCGQVAWDRLPDSWLGWDAADVVVVGDASLSTASPAAVAALLRWAQTGGTLILPGGEPGAALAGTAFAPLLPLTNPRTAAVPGLPALSAWLGVSAPAGPVMLLGGTLRPGTQVLAGTPGQPLVLSRRYGSGRVIMPLFDFTVKPFKYWDQQQALWARLLVEPTAVHPLTDNLQARGNAPSQLAAATPQSRLPSLLTVGAFLVIYLLMLGPVQYLVLKGLDKREYAWVVTPAIIVSFCFGAYFVSLGTRGRQTVAQTISLIETGPGATAGRATSWSSIFSPTLGRYNLSFGEQVGGVQVHAGAGGGGGDCTVQQGHSLSLRHLAINMWSSRAFDLISLVDLKQGLEVQQCEWDGSQLHVRLRNHTGLPFVSTCLARVGQRLDTGRLAPEGQLVGDLSGGLGSGVVSSMGRRPSTGPMALPPSAGPPVAASGHGSNPADELRLQVLDQLLGSGIGSPYYRAGRGNQLQPYFIGFVENPAVDISYDRPVRRTDLTAVAMPLPVQLPSRRIIGVPSWLMQSAPLGPTSSGGIRDVVTRYRLPAAPSGFRVVALEVSAPGGRPGGRPRLYNHATRQWVQITGGSLAQPQQYCNASGELLMQTDYTGVLGPQLTCVVQTN